MKYSPEQIAGRLKREFPDDPEMRVSTETIYQSLYVQSRGALRRDLTAACGPGARCAPCRKPGQRKNRIPDMINVSERPAEADDRAVPGHWEGDLIIGTKNLTAIGTLVERTTGYTMLVHLPDGYEAEQVRDALAAKIKTLPDRLRASLTWDQGPEMRDWKHVASPPTSTSTSATRTHRGSARPTRTPTGCYANTSRKAATCPSTPLDLEWVAAELNDRPRKRLGFTKPIEEIGPLLLR